MRIRAVLLIAALAVGFVALSGATRALSAKNVTETRALDGFTRVSLNGLADLEITVGEDHGLTVTADEDMIGRIRTKVRGNRLIIDFKDSSFDLKSFSDLKIEIKITMPALDALEIEGLADVTVGGLDAEDFELQVDGKADVELRGRCTRAEFELDGWIDLDARDFKCHDVVIEFDGMGDASVFASDSIDASTDGMGDIKVHGHPKKVVKDEDGWGDIKIRD